METMSRFGEISNEDENGEDKQIWQLGFSKLVIKLGPFGYGLCPKVDLKVFGHKFSHNDFNLNKLNSLIMDE